MSTLGVVRLASYDWKAMNCISKSNATQNKTKLEIAICEICTVYACLSWLVALETTYVGSRFYNIIVFTPHTIFYL